MTVIGNSAGPYLDWHVERLRSRRGLFCIGGAAFDDSRLCAIKRGIRRNCHFPAVENGFRISWTINQRNFVQHQTGDGLWVAGLALRDAPANGETSIDLTSYLGHRDRVDNMGNNPGSSVLAHFGFKRRSGGGKLMHFSESRKTHIVRDRCANGICPHDLSLFVHSLGCCDPVHPHGTVILRLNLLDCAVKPHNLKSQSDVGIGQTERERPCRARGHDPGSLHCTVALSFSTRPSLRLAVASRM